MKPFKLLLFFSFWTIHLIAFHSIAWSQSKSTKTKTIPFLKTSVIPMSGIYVVLKDANVRSNPATKGRRIGRRARGDHVTVVGKAKGHWLAISDGKGKDIGFIYRSILMPLVDGTLKKPLNGRLKLPNAKLCDYSVHFEGKSPAEDQVFQFADYRINWNCKLDKGLFSFYTPMFFSEGPYRGTYNRIHQITIDIPGLAEDMESVFSTHALWDRDNARVKFDSISLKQFSRVPNVKKVKAETIIEALHGTLKIATSAWNGPLWQTIIRRQKNIEN